MTLHAWITLAVVAGALFALVRNLAAPDLIFVGAAVVLAMTGVISTSEAFEGFSNSGVITLAGLFVVAAALRETGVLDSVGHRFLGGVKSESQALIRLGALVTTLSAFINNTPIVAMFVPVIIDWCKKRGFSPSRLLIPLSYFTILGGTCTLIGTSTNLVVNGLLEGAHRLPPPGAEAASAAWSEALRPMTLFELAPAGVPYAILGVAYILIAAPRLLPRRKELMEQFGESRREYLVEMQIMPGCRLAGESIESAGLRHLPGLFLIEIQRGENVIAPVAPETVMAAGDRLVFAGLVSTIVDLEKIPGLVPAADPAYELAPEKRRGRLMAEAVISQSSPLAGVNVRDANFRSRYDAAVIAVHRNGGRLTGKIGDIVLRPGDTLLLQAGSAFARVHRNNPDFYLVSNVEDSRPVRHERSMIALGVFFGLVLLMSAEAVNTAVLALLAAGCMVLARCISTAEARRAVEWEVLITIAAAFAVGRAIENSGLSAVLAEGIVGLTRDLGPVGALAAIYLITAIITEMITNNAAAILIFPFCLNTALLLDASPRPFVMAVTLAASASFATPIGYQTNMMVYGPGGYRFSDFIRIGMPLQVILWIAAIFIIPRVWPF